MLIGVDFDNTIVCYDRLFHQVAVEQGLIPPEIPASKEKVRDYLRQADQEDKWTEMQGYVYGVRMKEADPFPGVLDFFAYCVKQQINVCIISHKTRHPYLGPQYDLHEAAQSWLENQGFYDQNRIGLSANQVYFELTKQEKLQRIGKQGCTHFIDDLPEFLGDANFPLGVDRILFDPQNFHVKNDQFRRVTAWSEVENLLL